VGSFAYYLIATIIYHFNIYIPSALIGGLTLGVVFLIHTYASWQTRRPKFTYVTVSLPNLPESWRGKRIVFVSDVHLGAISGTRFCAKVVEKIKAESPEMVLIGGDLFDGVKCHPGELIAPFGELHPPEGIYYVTGNHEYVNGSIGSFMDSIRNTHIRILHNEVVDVRGLQIAGTDWKETRRADAYAKIIDGLRIDRGKPSILIKHEPSDLAVAEKAGVSLQLSGHTHHGQIWPLRIITKRVYRGFDYGLKKLRTLQIFTSSGVGTWGPPLRFGTKAEIVAITLDKAK
jgi:predicted MPP superfamily phosphohydrolase